jgi:hypothetical protein
MSRRALTLDESPVANAALDPMQPITADDRVGDVLTLYPWLLDIFVSSGFKPLRNPLLRKTLARRVTIAQACCMMDVDVPKLLEALNKLRAQRLTPAREETGRCGSNASFPEWDKFRSQPSRKDAP